MREVAQLALMLLFYGGPLLFIGIWFVRLRQRPESPRWRWVMSWVSLSLATVAVGAWLGTLTGIPSYPGEGVEHLQHGFTIIRTSLCGAFVAALLAKGKGRAWAVASVLPIPLHWFIEHLF